ncbi:c-type cytochrome [Nitrosococcus wardiae]|uniref:Cytochrome c n=1 Tax=Nitrosococcus wardiae TaxID=1814290 RepID=A0A4P7BYA1_9GAMM|nr:cytochrome c [Nitrosococcus wardiae]QBQ55158.1 cytochrome c [Nitrosococcus wardiae]
MRILAVVGALAIFTALFFSVVVFSGYFNVAATEPHTPPGRWLLSTTMTQSVRYHAQAIKAPPLGEAVQLADGFRHYQAHCETCHGAPGVPPGKVGKGLTPEPPELDEAASHWSAEELFWIIKHGIRMTGMPAWGVSFSEEKLWALVAFVQELPEITPADYQKMAASIEHGAHKKAPSAH